MPADSKKNIAVILLAAGASSRFGKPKQLLSYNGQTLLQHSLQAAKDSIAHPIIVVLGAHADILKKEIDDSIARAVINEGWQEGMASSIRFGIKRLVEIDPSAEAALLMVCDQPYTSSTLINTLIEAHENTKKPIIACSYADTFGPPTLFHKSIFPELLQLKGDTGAKNVIQKHFDEVEVVLFPEGSLDIDTQEDYQKLAKSNS